MFIQNTLMFEVSKVFITTVKSADSLKTLEYVTSKTRFLIDHFSLLSNFGKITNFYLI